MKSNLTRAAERLMCGVSSSADAPARKRRRDASGAATHEYNLVSDVDSYKYAHSMCYPEGTTQCFSYVEDRVGAKFPVSLVFGFQYYCKRYLCGRVVTAEKIRLVAERQKWHGEPFEEDKWLHIVREHGGRLPIRIRAVPEGTAVPVGNCLRTLEATCPRCAWLPSFLETSTLRDWGPRSVATQGLFAKAVILEGLIASSEAPKEALPFALHDFGGRGVTCAEQAGINGLAHLVNWKGTDTVIAMEYAEVFYSAGPGSAFSVPALEHSTVLAWGRGGSLEESLANQEKCFLHAINKWCESGFTIASLISDTYDVRRTIKEQFCGSLLATIQARHREAGFRVVVRLDSGEPVSAMVVRALEDMESALPSGLITSNAKGYKLLPPYFRFLQGDGVSLDTLPGIERALLAAGWATENLAARGMGGKNLHSGTNRDTQRTAQKVSMVCVQDTWLDVSKMPLDDPQKASKPGWLDLIRDPVTRELRTVQIEPETRHPDSALELVFENGAMVKEWSLDEVRARAEEALDYVAERWPQGVRPE